MQDIAAATGIDPWFLHQMRELLDAEAWFAGLDDPDGPAMRRMKRMGFSDRQLARLRGTTEAAMRERR